MKSSHLIMFGKHLFVTQGQKLNDRVVFNSYVL